VVKTDHNSLKHFLEQKDLSERQQKWVNKVQAYDFDIEHVKGKKVADALSRRPTTFAMSGVAADWKSPFGRVFQEHLCKRVDKWKNTR